MNDFDKTYNNCKNYLQKKVIVDGCRDYDTADQVQEVLTSKNCFSLAENARDALLLGDGEAMTTAERVIIRRAIREDWQDEALAAALLVELLHNNRRFCRSMFAYRDGVWYYGHTEWYKDIDVDEYAAATTKEAAARTRRA